MTKSSRNILELVERALDEFDEVGLSVSTRRGIRIANLLGETKAALRLVFEVKHVGGAPHLNAEETRRYLLEPSQWNDEEGPVVEALNAFMADRKVNDDSGKSAVHSLDEIEYLLTLEGLDLQTRRMLRQILQTTRSRLFSFLCAWERELAAATTNETALSLHQRRVDEVLTESSPDVLSQFNAVFRRLAEAAETDSTAEANEALAQAVATCRRILKAVVDVVQPADDARSRTADGHSLSEAAYKNRLFEFLKTSTSQSQSHVNVLSSAGTSLWDRFEATNVLASKGVHAAIARDEAELCALNTYLLAGELLRFSSRPHSDSHAGHEAGQGPPGQL